MQTKQQRLKEIEYQSKMLNHLKEWMRNLIVLSSIGAVFAYWGIGMMNGILYQAIGVIGILWTSVCVVLCIIVGLAFKNGKNNIEKIIQLVQS